VGSRDDEIGWVDRIGWLGNRLWVADPRYRQLAIIDERGKVIKSLEHPSWIRPTWADRRRFPIFARLEPLALYADGSWLVVPRNERSLVDTPEYDRNVAYIVRISAAGSIQRTVARVPRDEGNVIIASGAQRRTMGIPYFPRTVWDVSSDGTRVAVVSTSMTGPDSATFRVTVIGAQGDSVFSRRLPFVPMRMTAQSIDSIRTNVRTGVGARSADEIRTLVTQRTPRYYPPVAGVRVGRDHTTWVQLRPTADGRPWLVLDSAGAPIGMVTLPKEVMLQEADREHVWGFERSAGRIDALVRYRVRS